MGTVSTVQGWRIVVAYISDMPKTALSLKLVPHLGGVTGNGKNAIVIRKGGAHHRDRERIQVQCIDQIKF